MIAIHVVLLISISIISCMLKFSVANEIQSDYNFTAPIDVLWPDWMNITQMWEADYIGEMFPSPVFNHVHESTNPGVIVCCNQRQVPMIENLTSEHQIGVLIHLSDEFMGTNGETLACSQVYHRAKLVLRQYAFHGEHHHSNLVQIPLGFITGMLSEYQTNSTIENQSDSFKSFVSLRVSNGSLSHTSSMRKHNWSFVGGKHGKGKMDRLTAIRVFSHWGNHEIRESMKPYEMKHIYDDSRFVIVGRGWNTIDCLRIYESIISGAIPVVVANHHEITHIFEFNGDLPPLVFANNWESALNICKKMTYEEIDAKRLEVVTWYQHKIFSIQKKVMETFHLNSTIVQQRHLLR